MLENDAPIVNKFAHRFVSFQNRLILVFRPQYHLLHARRQGRADRSGDPG